MFALTLRQANHERRYSIVRTGSLGWEIRLEQDSQLQRLDHYQDWHRVERALALFARETSQLQESGWQIVNEAISEFTHLWCERARERATRTEPAGAAAGERACRGVRAAKPLG